MRSEHWRPLVASIVVVVVCGAMMVHAIRTDAVGGLLRSAPMRVLTGELVQPRPVEPPRLSAPLEPIPSASVPAPTPDTAAVSPSDESVADQPVKKSVKKAIHKGAATHHSATSVGLVEAATPRPDDEPSQPSQPSQPSKPSKPSQPVSQGRGHTSGSLTSEVPDEQELTSEGRAPAVEQGSDAWSHASDQVEGAERDWRGRGHTWRDRWTGHGWTRHAWTRHGWTRHGWTHGDRNRDDWGRFAWSRRGRD